MTRATCPATTPAASSPCPRRASARFRVRSTITRRGLYAVGPVMRHAPATPSASSATSAASAAPQNVLVYPRATELPNFQVPPANLPGEGRFRRRTHYVTPNASGVRPYESGDSFNRIHWPSTARTGELMVKIFELDPASDIWVILDLDRDVHVGEGDDSTEEYGVRIAASVARYFLTANRSVGFMSFGRSFDVIDAERGIDQYTRILESLAMARTWGDVPLHDLISNEARRFGRHTTVVVITPSTDERWVAALNLLHGRGVKVAAIVLEPSTFGGDEELARRLRIARRQRRLHLHGQARRRPRRTRSRAAPVEARRVACEKPTGTTSSRSGATTRARGRRACRPSSRGKSG